MTTVKEFVEKFGNPRDFVSDSYDLPPNLPSDFKLPKDLPLEIYKNGLSCVGTARLFVEAYGISHYRIMWIDWIGSRSYSHAFVIKNDAKPDELALNNTWNHKLTNREVLENGRDRTEEFLNKKWEEIW